MFEDVFFHTFFLFNEELEKAQDNNLRKALYFCFKNYKETLLFQYKNCLEQKRINGKEVDLDVIISEVLLFDNKICDKYEEFKKKVESKIEIQKNNYNGEYNKFKKCPHCGFYGLTEQEKEKNIIKEKEGKIKINSKECGKNLNMNEMDDVLEEALKILKKGINLDSEDY